MSEAANGRRGMGNAEKKEIERWGKRPMSTIQQDMGSEGVSFMFTIQRRRYREATGRKTGRLAFQSSDFGLNGVTGGYELNARFLQPLFFTVANKGR